MKGKISVLASLIMALIIGTGMGGPISDGDELARLRAATARFHRVDRALAAGYGLVPDLDHCFDNPGVGAMGVHYIDADRLDTVLDLERPEAMVYAPGPNGKLKLGAVEYIVPADAWDESGNPGLPELFDRSFHLNADLGVYVLHVWVWKNNPAGMFEDWNPNVSCP